MVAGCIGAERWACRVVQSTATGGDVTVYGVHELSATMRQATLSSGKCNGRPEWAASAWVGYAARLLSCVGIE